MRRSLFTLSIIVGSFGLFGCSSSHTGPCAEPITCYQGWSGDPGCCLEGTATTACGACPAGTFAEAECGSVDPVCEGVPADGGAGCFGPTPLCYEGWSGSTDCCLEPGTPASCAGGGWQCPAGTYSSAECGRLDPVCEGVDGGPGTGLYDDCAVTSDCTLVATTCCGTCGQPARGDVDAVHVDRTTAYYLDVACPEARSEPPICPDCAGMPNPHLAATCDMTGFRPACAVVDFAEPEFASCTADTDCRLAAPECCACGEISPYETIAVRNDADLSAVLCDHELACPPCAPIFDERATARCDAGQCVVDLAP